MKGPSFAKSVSQLGKKGTDRYSTGFLIFSGGTVSKVKLLWRIWRVTGEAKQTGTTQKEKIRVLHLMVDFSEI